jgi:hypothetical protein
MRLRRPSPSLVISFIALFAALTGTAFAAVNFATNAGAVDGKSAVADGASRDAAAGRLVATRRSGSEKGTIASRYLDPSLAKGQTATFGKYLAVADNQTLAPEAIGTVPGLGSLTAQCFDQNAVAGNEDPATRVAFANQSGEIVNFSRTVGNTDPVVSALANNVQDTFTIGGSNTFELHIERKGINYFVRGVVRQDGRGTANANCLIYGFSLATSS